jgi:hypothetical protein
MKKSDTCRTVSQIILAYQRETNKLADNKLLTSETILPGEYLILSPHHEHDQSLFIFTTCLTCN